MNNPLLTKVFVTPFDRIEAGHVEPAIDLLIERTQDAVDEIIERAELSYDATLGALDEATDVLEWAAGVVGHLEAVATTDELRAAYLVIQPKLSKFWSGITLNEPLYRLLKDYSHSDAAATLDSVHQRHLTKTLDGFRRSGAELDEAGKKRMAEINVELAELTTRFSQNLLDATNDFEFVIQDETRLSGLPESAREAARASAAAKNLEGWRFTLQAPSVIAVLTYLDADDVRETIWRAHSNRCAGGRFDNRIYIERILELRREKASLLGYRDFADVVLEDRMAKSGETAASFIADLREKTEPHFRRENEELIAFRKALGHDGPMQPWDTGYYAEKERAAHFHFDEEELRPYFSADKALNGVFQTVTRLYGITIAPDNSLPTWHPDVRTYRVTDGGEHIASFYVDLFPREEKRGGAWMHSLITGRPPDEPHLGLICANVTPPIGDKPALLTHREVETLFHEFGHLMHHCLSRVPVKGMAGTSVAWDFVELPSQIMENWCWERESLDLFACNWETDEPIPESLFEQMVSARTYRAANQQMRQLGFSAVDLALHRDYSGEDGDVVAYARRVLAEYHPTPLPDDYSFVTTFGHLFSGSVGYAAGYYSYKWAEVLDADAFTRFKTEGVFNPTVGDHFRRAILERGDSAEPSELYKEFMGREPRMEALLERLGMIDRV